MRSPQTLILYILFFSLSASLAAQPINQYVKDITLPTPNAAALGQYIDVPVNYFTGTPNISIPLYTAQDGTLQDAISLSYHASGIKTTQQASWVGLGWNINAGGMITRTVQGIPDTKSQGYYFYNSRLDFYAGITGTFIASCGAQNPNDSYVTDVADGVLDGESDIYSFTVPGGYSGKFLIDKNKSAVLIPKQDIKIKIVNTVARFTHIIITTPDGNDHYFGNTIGGSEEAYDFQTAGGQNYIVNWHLVQSSSYDGLYNINYSYSNDSYDYRVPKSNTIEYIYNSISGQTNDVQNTGNSYTTIAISGKKLSTITTVSETINFTSTLGRTDLLNSEALNQIQINTGGYCKRFDLTYDYFTEGVGTQPEEKQKLKLNTVKERSCDGTVTDIPAYTFDYYGTLQSNAKIYLPGLLSKQTDHWGFYNGQTGNDSKPINLPSTTLLSCSGASFSEGSANRNVNTSKVDDGSLQKITYPTGGSSSFTYEAHDAQYPSSSVNPMNKFTLSTCGSPGSNCCGDQDTTWTGPFTLTEVSNNITFDYQLVRNPLPPPNNCASNVSTDLHVVLDGDTIASLGFNLDISEMSKDYNDIPISDLIGFGILNSDVNYSFILTSENGFAQFSLTTADFALDTKDIGGIRIQEIRHYDGIDPTRDIVYQYEYLDPDHPTESSGLILAEPNYGFKHQGSAGPNGGSSGLCLLHFSDTPTVPLGDFEGHHIAYKHVKEIQVDNGHKTYRYNLGISPAYYLAVGGKYMSIPIPLDKSKGFLLKQGTYDNDEVRLQQDSSQFKSETNTAIAGVMVRAQKTNCTSGSDGHTFWRQYGMETGRRSRLEEQISFLDGVITTTSYAYDAMDRFAPPASMTMTNSGSNKFHDLYTYPVDISGSVYDSLEALNLVTPLITEKRTGNDINTATKTDRIVTEYDFHTTGNGTFPYPKRYARDEVTWSPGHTVTNNVTQATIIDYDDITGQPSAIDIDGWDNLSYTWNANGTIKIKDYQGFKTQYNYHGTSRLLSGVINVDETSHGYEYDQVFRLKNLRDSCRNTLTTLDYNYGSPSGGNFIRTTINYDQVTNSALNIITNRQYMDGLGRATQIVKEDQGPNSNDDIYAVTRYDKRGRVSFQTEPKSFTGSGGAYQSESTSNLWDRLTTTYEESPLNRPISTIHTAWPYPDSIHYGANKIGIDNLGVGELYEVIKVDGDRKRSITYKDKRGRVVATTLTGEDGITPLSTLRQYDDKDRLKSIVPPAAVLTDTNLIFTYQYYGNDLIALKKIPDRQVIEYRYNDKDLLVHYQDGYLRAQPLLKWMAYNYDPYGRPTKSGFRTTAQANNLTGNPSINNNDRLTVTTYYPTSSTHKDKIEDYEVSILFPDGSLSTELLKTEYVYDDCGRVSTTKTENLLSLNDVDNLTHIYSYDGADNVLFDDHQQIILGTHNFDVTRTIDFAGRPLLTKQRFDALGTRTISEFAYNEKDLIAQHKLGLISGSNYMQTCDYFYRGNQFLENVNNVLPSNNDLFHLDLRYDTLLTASGGQVQKNGNIAQLLSQVTGSDRMAYGLRYDEYNRLERGTYRTYNNAGTFQQTNDYNTSYGYDDRGNISSIERNGLYPENGTFVEGEIDDLTINYQSKTNKISTIVDNGSSIQKSRGAKSSNGASFMYDANGSRTIDPTKGAVISYTHFNLPRHIDLGNGRTIEFTYDADGNQLRKQVSGGFASIENRYYIDGAEYKDNQLVQLIHDEGRVARATACDQNHFIGGILDNTDQFHGDHIISNSSVVPSGLTEFKADESIILKEYFEVSNGKVFEAEIVPCPTSIWQFEYAIKDHLGNTRVLFTEDGADTDNLPDILQVNNYYPFGMLMEGNWQGSLKNDFSYLYNGKELHRDWDLGWAMYGARFYDPSLGRFTGVDPIADKFAHVSTYNYAENRVPNGIDLHGLQFVGFHEGILRAQIENNRGKEALKEYDQASLNAGAIVVGGAASLFIPGPEDLVIAGFVATKFGGAILNVISKAGSAVSKGFKGLFKSGDEAADVSKLADELLETSPNDLVPGETTDPEIVSDLVENMKSNGFDANQPIETVSLYGKDYVLNGHHRLEAAKKAGVNVIYKRIPADQAVSKYNFRDSQEIIWRAIEHNTPR